MGSTDIAAEKYVAFTTFRKSGEAKATPVWIADLGDGTVGFTTPASSWKARRLANDHRVKVQPSDGRGRVKAGTEPLEGTAQLVEGVDFERVLGMIRAKYGWQATLMSWYAKAATAIGRSGRVSDTGVIITLD